MGPRLAFNSFKLPVSEKAIFHVKMLQHKTLCEIKSEKIGFLVVAENEDSVTESC